jgi:hypothetical protein
MNNAFASLNKCINAYKLILSFGKTKFMKFCTSSKTCVNQNVWYDDKTIEELETTKFVVLQIDSNINQETRIQYLMSKLSSACFAMSKVTSLKKSERIKLVYVAYFQFIMLCGIIWRVN